MIPGLEPFSLDIAKDSSIEAYLCLADRALHARQLRFPVRPKKHVFKQHYFFHQKPCCENQSDQLGFPTSFLRSWGLARDCCHAVCGKQLSTRMWPWQFHSTSCLKLIGGCFNTLAYPTPCSVCLLRIEQPAFTWIFMWGLYWQNDSCDSGHAQRPKTGRECPHHMVYGVVWLNIWSCEVMDMSYCFFKFGVNWACFFSSLHLRLKNKLHSNAFTDAMAQWCWENGLECCASDHGTHGVPTTNHSKPMDFYNFPSMYLGSKTLSEWTWSPEHLSQGTWELLGLLPFAICNKEETSGFQIRWIMMIEDSTQYVRDFDNDSRKSPHA